MFISFDFCVNIKKKTYAKVLKEVFNNDMVIFESETILKTNKIY